MSPAREDFPRISAFVPAVQALDLQLSSCCSITLFSYGFRPFFLGAAVWAIVSLVAWIGIVAGVWSFATSYGPVAWHAHEALFGYGGGVVAGFLLTAVPNWTGRLPVSGCRLGVLFAIWCAGRLAFVLSDMIGPVSAAVVDSIFLPVVLAYMAHEIVASRNWRNLRTLFLVGFFTAANIGFHLEVLSAVNADVAGRLGVSALIGLIMLIGGRIVPGFTHTWLESQNATRFPVEFNRFDIITLMVGLAVLALWIVRPHGAGTALVLVLAGVVHSLRMWRWAGLSTWREPMVWILHIGYGFIPLGFFLVAMGAINPVLMLPGVALHAWTIGAVGVMTLGVMTRAICGHTGRAFTASRLTVIVYVAIIVAALLRIAPGIVPMEQTLLVEAAAVAWIGAYTLFLIEYAPSLVQRESKP